MGLLGNFFKKNQKTREKLQREVFQLTKDIEVNMDVLKKQANEHPDKMILQEVKNPEEFQARYHALHYSMEGEYEKSIKYSTQGLKINPKSAYLYYMKGRSKGDLGLFEEGIKDLDKAIKLKPDYADAFVERGYIHRKMGNLKEAKKDYEKAKRIEPDIELPEGS